MEKNSEASPVAAPAGTRKMGNLRFIWRYASHYPGRVAAAALSLLLASGATLALPSGFKRVIDKGFVAGGGDITPYFHYLFTSEERRIGIEVVSTCRSGWSTYL